MCATAYWCMSLGDALIAATALEHGLTLMTRNVRDFAQIPGLMLAQAFKRDFGVSPGTYRRQSIERPVIIEREAAVP